MRYLSLDALRGFAILGMIVDHSAAYFPIDPGDDEGIFEVLDARVFVLVMGLSAGITLARAAQRPRIAYVKTWLRRAVLIILLGVLLSLHFSGVPVVLENLGLTMVLATPFLFLRTRWLVTAIVAWLVVGPIVRLPIELLLAGPDSPAVWMAYSPLQLLLLSEDYLVLGYVPVLLLGVLLHRIQFGRLAPTFVMLGAGLVLAVISLTVLRPLETAAGWTGFWTWSAAGLATAAAVGLWGVTTLAFDLAPFRVRLWAAKLGRPLIDIGMLSLSVYTLHVLLLTPLWVAALHFGWQGIEVGVSDRLYPLWRDWESPYAWWILIGVLVVCVPFALIWNRTLGPGPVERLLGVASLRHPPSYLTVVAPVPPASSTVEPRPGEVVSGGQ
ncbi:acyltransferase family protein [Agromyces intestinalis]|uniref:acyltransferase family protein n=1 Tax=Agromyces intestinalis TaxID=2592652 RepID=UPI00143D2BAF|nr:acyltransferase family protein [Agromyces intestinalis]